MPVVPGITPNANFKYCFVILKNYNLKFCSDPELFEIFPGSDSELGNFFGFSVPCCNLANAFGFANSRV